MCLVAPKPTNDWGKVVTQHMEQAMVLSTNKSRLLVVRYLTNCNGIGVDLHSLSTLDKEKGIT